MPVPPGALAGVPGIFLSLVEVRYGRLFRDARGAAVAVVDVLVNPRVFLACLVFLLCAMALTVPGVSRASSNASYDYSMQLCTAEVASKLASGWRSAGPCALQAGTNKICWSGVNPNGVSGGPYCNTFIGDAPSPCEDAPDISASMDMKTGGSAVGCNSGCKYYLADGRSTSNGLGDSLASGNWKPTGGVCPAEGLPAIGGGNGDGDDGGRVCGFGACYDPEGDEYCYTSSFSKTCVSGATARGEGTGAGDTPTGGCASNANSTICAGSPPPLPPKPPESPISDPTSEIGSSDKFSSTSVTGGTASSPPVAGSNATTNVNVYGAGNAPTSSGQGPADKGPAPPSSTGAPPGDGEGEGKDKGSVAGGMDCGSPPVCSGDAPTCGVVTQTWLLRCGASKGDGNNNGQPDWTEIDGSKDDGYGVEETGLSGVFTEKTVDGAGLDESGWVGSSCPLLPSGGMVDFSEYQDFFCRWLVLIRGIVLLFAAFVAVRIMARGAE